MKMQMIEASILATVLTAALLQIEGAARRRQNDDGSDKEFPYADLVVNIPKNTSTLKKIELIQPPPPMSNNYWAALEAAEPGYNLTDDEIKKFKIWRNGVIPYHIDNFSFDKAFIEKLRRTLESANSITGLRFSELSKVPENDNERWVLFINRRGVLECEDYTTSNFTNEGVQRIVVGYDCLGGKGTLAATLLALLGVPPQHNAPDRDKYITVLYDNIMPVKHSLFQPLKNEEWLFHNVQYDYHSAGHYDCHMYTVNGAATIKIKKENLRGDEDRDCFSKDDIWKIRMLYNYMLRKRRKATASDCSKLYKPGDQFKRFSPIISGEDIVPRNKPEQYLNPNSVPTNEKDANLEKKYADDEEVVNAEKHDADEDKNNKDREKEYKNSEGKDDIFE